MEKQLKIGIDISKRKLDVSFIETTKLKSHAHFIVSNNQEGIHEIIFKAEKQGFSKENIFVCYEHTGVYGMPLCYYLQEMDVDYAMVPALEIYRSKGITRGKNDKVDSKDIAYYAVFNAHKIEPTELPVNTLVKLKILLSFRDKLVRSIGSFQRTREVKGFMPEEMVGDVFEINEHLLKLLRKELRDLDKRINDLIKKDPELYEKFNLVKSVVGVGKQTALHLLMYTRGFTTFDSWRKMACYAGVAPFEYSSGSSIRGKTKVSPLANKKLKSLLNMAAITAIRYDPELEKYYQKKLSEGKNPMSVINAVRCKILSRIFATVKRGTPFVKLNALAY